MSYRRRETFDASMANPLSKTERLAAVSSIRLVRHLFSDSVQFTRQRRRQSTAQRQRPGKAVTNKGSEPCKGDTVPSFALAGRASVVWVRVPSALPLG
jgi:hypothetical protein